MRISKLDLFGFKSFPDRTLMQFGGGISCVVGPNGSGKSNVVDALKWVIGEQSARSLRGAEMSDVIFAGSTDRKPVGFAEVSLTLDAAGGEPFPGDYAQLQEIQVGRRLHRSGASEYLINQVRCRRKDVVDLFLDTGIGTNLYSFIEQGRVDKVVSATPHERRGLIDEAAGISRYKARREEARSRLEATAGQLDRAADVADEMGRRLKVLERQVLKAANFRRLRARVRQREVYLSLVKYRGLAGDRRALQTGLREARAEEAAARRGLARREEDLRTRREEIQSVEEAARTWRDELAEVDARLRELASQEGLQKQRAVELEQQVQSASEEAAASQAESHEARTQREGLQTQRAETAAALANEGADGGDREARLGASAQRLADHRVARDAAEGAWRKAEAERARLEVERGAVEEQRDALPGRVVKLEVALAEAEVAARDALAEATEAEGAVAAQVARVEARAADLAEAEEALGRVDASRAAMREAADAALSEAMAAAVAARAALDEALRQQASERDALRRARDKAAEEARQRRDQGVRDLRERADVWSDGVSGEAQRRLDGARERLEEVTAHWARMGDESEADVRRRGERDGELRLREVESQVQQALSPVVSGERRARERVQQARDALDRSRIELAEAEVRLAGLVARLAAHDRPAALAHAKPLVDRLDPSEAEAAVLAWGPRASLPALEAAVDIVRAAGALQAGEGAQVLWLRDRSNPPVHRAPTLEAALAHHAEHGGAALSPQGRVEGDGVVHLGAEDAGAQRARWRGERVEAEARALRLADAVAEGAVALKRAEEGLEAASAAVVEARADAEQALRDARRQVVEDTKRQVTDALEALREERDAAIGDAREDVARWRGRTADVAASLRRQRQEAVERGMGSLDAVLEAELASVPGGDAAPADADVLGCTERVRQADEAVRAVREHGIALPPREQAAARVASFRQALEAAVAERSAADAARAAVSERATNAGRRRSELEERLAELRHEAARWVERLVVLEERLAEASTAAVAAEQAYGVAAGVHEAATTAHGELTAASMAADAGRRAMQERLDGQEARLAELDVRIAGLLERHAAAEARRDEASLRAEQARQAAAAAAGEIGTLTAQRGEVFDRLSRERGRAQELRDGVQSAEQDLGQLRDRLELATRTTQELVDRSASVRAEIEALRERIDEKYQVGIPGMLDRLERAGRLALEADPEVAQGVSVGGHAVEGVEPLELRAKALDDEGLVRSCLAELEADRAALARLGEVHLGALDEYTELAARHGDLEAQRADLEGSVASLRTAIAKMNRTCRERFREAFDRVNENFQLSYPKLLGGGSARLALTDDEDLLETGVEIFVQPPGKRLQHLQLLSGGEKAMTAIALLIALFRVKPSPFCVLDEVDAPLDERNGGRFNTMLRELAQTSQFVVITHNRKTMECADTLYGISMTKPGVSTLVTVTLAAR